MIELTTVADDEAVFHDGAARASLRRARARHASTRSRASRSARLPRPERGAARHGRHRQRRALRRGGVRRDRGRSRSGPILRSEPGEPPYPEMMNRAADRRDRRRSSPTWSSPRATSRPTARTRSTSSSSSATAPRSASASCTCAATTTATTGETFADRRPVEVELPGRPRGGARHDDPRSDHRAGDAPSSSSGSTSSARRSDRPVLVFGHHHVWSPESNTRHVTYFGINPDDSEAPGRRVRAAPVARRLLRRAHPPQPGAPVRAPRATCRGSRWRASRTSPARGPSTACSRAASCRSTGASRRPRRSTWTRAHAGHVRRPLSRLRVRRARPTAASRSGPARLAAVAVDRGNVWRRIRTWLATSTRWWRSRPGCSRPARGVVQRALGPGQQLGRGASACDG